MSMDITETLAPRSDQQNYDDYLGGMVRTVTISEVRRGSAEQPVELHLIEFPGRPYKPGKSMRRVIAAAWGTDASVYAGRRLTLYGDPSVKFGGQVMGGIRISHLSHIDKPLNVNLTITRGKRAPFTVQPLPDAPQPPPATPAPTAEDIAAATDIGALQGMWRAATDDDTRAQIEARVAEIRAGEQQ